MSASSRRGDHVLEDVVARATIDLEFRRRLLRNASGVILEEFGVTIPSGHEIRFIERPKDVDTLIVLPEFQAAGDELDDDDLGAVAGGTACHEDSAVW